MVARGHAREEQRSLVLRFALRRLFLLVLGIQCGIYRSVQQGREVNADRYWGAMGWAGRRDYWYLPRHTYVLC